MPLGIESLDFIDDAVDSVMGGLDDLFTSDEERKKAENKLQKLKNSLKLGVKEHTRKVLQIHAKDRQDARDAQDVALRKAWWAMPLLMILTYLGFFGILAALVFFDVQTQANQVLLVLLGTLGTIVTQIAHFLWGSSAGSKQKDEQIRHMVNQADLRQANSGAAGPQSSSSNDSESSLDKKVKTLEPAPITDSDQKHPGW